MKVLKINNVHKVYDETDVHVHAVNGVTIDFEEGEFAAIVGPSGSGKTTLLNIIGGLDKPTEGEILVNDTDLSTLKPSQLTLLLLKVRRIRVMFTIGGYLSSVNTAMFEKPSSVWYNDYLLHNRVNTGITSGSKFSASFEFRNRFFSGDMVQMTPGFDISTGFDKGLMDLTWNIASGGSYLLNVTADRAWVDYNSGKLQVRVGRQRINWGQALVWNPNDIFNVYSFFDFDYDERPGSDAVRIQYYTSPSSFS